MYYDNNYTQINSLKTLLDNIKEINKKKFLYLKNINNDTTDNLENIFKINKIKENINILIEKIEFENFISDILNNKSWSILYDINIFKSRLFNLKIRINILNNKSKKFKKIKILLKNLNIKYTNNYIKNKLKNKKEIFGLWNEIKSKENNNMINNDKIVNIKNEIKTLNDSIINKFKKLDILKTYIENENNKEILKIQDKEKNVKYKKFFDKLIELKTYFSWSNTESIIDISNKIISKYKIIEKENYMIKNNYNYIREKLEIENKIFNKFKNKIKNYGNYDGLNKYENILIKSYNLKKYKINEDYKIKLSIKNNSIYEQIYKFDSFFFLLFSNLLNFIKKYFYLISRINHICYENGFNIDNYINNIKNLLDCDFIKFKDNLLKIIYPNKKISNIDNFIKELFINKYFRININNNYDIINSESFKNYLLFISKIYEKYLDFIKILEIKEKINKNNRLSNNIKIDYRKSFNLKLLKIKDTISYNRIKKINNIFKTKKSKIKLNNINSVNTYFNNIIKSNNSKLSERSNSYRIKTSNLKNSFQSNNSTNTNIKSKKNKIYWDKKYIISNKINKKNIEFNKLLNNFRLSLIKK